MMYTIDLFSVGNAAPVLQAKAIAENLTRQTMV